MDNKAKYLKLLFVLLIIGFFFGVGWLLGKNKVGFFSHLPLTGGESAITMPAKQGDAIIVDSNKVASGLPWEFQIDRKTNFYEPQISELAKIYSDYINSLKNRDFSSFKTLASADNFWTGTQNRELLGYTDNNVAVYQTGLVNGQAFFEAYAPTLHDFSTPWNIKYFKPSRLASVASENPETSYYYDVASGLTYYINRERQIDVRRVYFNIDYFTIDRSVSKDFFPYKEDGYVDFIFENSHWLVLRESWQTQFVSNTNISDENLIITGNNSVKELQFNDEDATLKTIKLKKNDVVRWLGITGMVFSTSSPTGLEPWNSPILNNNGYQMSFNETGSYNYSVKSVDNTVMYSGRILILD